MLTVTTVYNKVSDVILVYPIFRWKTKAEHFCILFFHTTDLLSLLYWSKVQALQEGWKIFQEETKGINTLDKNSKIIFLPGIFTSVQPAFTSVQATP